MLQNNLYQLHIFAPFCNIYQSTICVFYLQNLFTSKFLRKIAKKPDFYKNMLPNNENYNFHY